MASAAPRYEFSYELSEELMRRGARRFLAQLVNLRALLAPALLLIVLVPICATDHGGYLCGLGTGAFIFAVLFIVLSYAASTQRAAQLARRLGNTRGARCTLTHEGIGVENALSRSFLTWGLVQKVVRSPDVWLIFIGRLQYVTLPADPLGGDAGRFIEARVSAAGGRML